MVVELEVMKGNFLLRNSWSDEGVSTISDGNGVKCESTHLTSFAVLVDVQDSNSGTHTATTVS